MHLSHINVTTQKEKQFATKGIYTVEDLLRFLPRKYHDFRNPISLLETKPKTISCLIGRIINIYINPNTIKAAFRDNISGKILYITWFKAKYMADKLKYMQRKDVICCGVVSYNEQYNNYEMTAPLVLSDEIEKYQTIYPVYSDINKMSDEYLQKSIHYALYMTQSYPDKYSEELREEFQLPTESQMYQMIHFPKSEQEYAWAKKRLIFEELYDFASMIEQEHTNMPQISPYIIKELDKTNEFIQSLDFELTQDQQNVLNSITDKMKIGKYVNALIQGDVSCGKTIVAFILMMAMAENGYQAALMCPTDVLATQHYTELKKYADSLGFKTCFYSGELKASEKKKICKGIESGEYNLIVGTHSVSNKNIVYKNLGLAVVDEEHKFGVNQRMSILRDSGTHSITMSATPIPRSIALCAYGKGTDVYTIKSMPNGRLPVLTCVYNKDETIYSFMKKQILDGRQCYIVCPLKSKSENNDTDVESVEEVYNKLFTYLNGTGIRIGMVTGGMKKEDTERVLQEFNSNEIQVLIATTIIEVGVNVPNASTIIIRNAERFGLANLHQLRGRVGRGKYQSYCVLQSDDLENVRLKAMVETKDGFEIALKDLEIRGPGDYIGTKQSGENKAVMLMLHYQEFYQKIEAYVEKESQNKVTLNFKKEIVN